MEKSLTSLFVFDHKRIFELINDLKAEKGREAQHKIFQKIDASLRDHLKEEEQLYSRYHQSTGELLPVFSSLKREHELFLHYLEDIKRSLERGIKAETKIFFSLLERHKNVEERLVYPEFDRVLSKKEKEEHYAM